MTEWDFSVRSIAEVLRNLKQRYRLQRTDWFILNKTINIKIGLFYKPIFLGLNDSLLTNEEVEVIIVLPCFLKCQWQSY